MTDLRPALQALYDACVAANAAAIDKLHGVVIDREVLDQARSALTGEQVVTFCGGWPNVLTGLWAEALIPQPLEWD